MINILISTGQKGQFWGGATSVCTSAVMCSGLGHTIQAGMYAMPADGTYKCGIKN